MLPEEKRYRLPLHALLLVMASTADRRLLHTRLPGVSGLPKQACQAQLVLAQGKVCSCTLLGANGRILLQQQEAYHALERCGNLDLEWRVLPLPSPGAGRAQVSSWFEVEERIARHEGEPPKARIPTLRVRSLSPDILASLSYSHRVTLMLVDGQRSIVEIARLLSKSPSDVQEMLAVLRHLVQFE